MPRTHAPSLLHPVLDHAAAIHAAVASSAPGRSSVAASWRRSLLHYRLDPQNRQRPDRLPERLMLNARERSMPFLQAADPFVARLAGVVLDSGSAILLADDTGMIVDGRLREADAALFEMVGLATGADWSEAAEGTNAIGTALIDGRAVSIWRDEHFFSRNLSLVCLSAPVEAADGSVAGVINVSSFRDDMTDLQARFTAMAVQDTAQQTGAALFHAGFPGARIITMGQEAGRGASLLAVNGDDMVIGANRAARRALNLTPQMLAQHPPLEDVLSGGEGAKADLAGAMRSEIARALQRAGGNATVAARDLGIGRATLYRKMQALGISRK